MASFSDCVIIAGRGLGTCKNVFTGLEPFAVVMTLWTFGLDFQGCCAGHLHIYQLASHKVQAEDTLKGIELHIISPTTTDAHHDSL